MFSRFRRASDADSAPLGLRALAYAADMAIVWIPAVVLTWLSTRHGQLLLDVMRQGPLDTPEQVKAYLGALVGMLIRQKVWLLFWVSFLYGSLSVIAEASPWQATPGKKWLGLMVVSDDGDRVDLKQSFLRFAGGVASWLTLNIGHVLVLGESRRSLSDRLAKTRVVQDGSGDFMSPSVRVRALLAGVVLLLLVFSSVFLARPDPVLAEIMTLLTDRSLELAM